MSFFSSVHSPYDRSLLLKFQLGSFSGEPEATASRSGRLRLPAKRHLLVLIPHENFPARHPGQGFEPTRDDQIRQLPRVAEIAIARPTAGELAAQILTQHI